jgi:pilus assembly protein CpaB
MDSVAGRVARVTIYKGEVILPGRLAPEGTEAGLQVKITPGKRAYGIRVSDMSSLAAMIRPNSRVDIMVVIDDPEQPGKRVAKLFMSNMRVLAIGPIEAAAATIEVSPEEAERLAVAASQGQIHLVLRGYGDPDSVRTLGRPMPNVMRLSRPDSLSVRVIRGTPPR